MRARAAYISSLGTTGILLAAAVLMLAIVSALVAFRAWPGGAGDSVAAVPVVPRAGTPAALTQVRSVRAPKRVVTRTVSRVVPKRTVARAPSATGLVKTTVVHGGTIDLVKVPPGIHMTFPTQPTTPPTTPSTPDRRDVPVPPTDPSSPLPDLSHGGPGPEDVERTISDVVGPLPGLTQEGSGPTIGADPGQGTMSVAVTIGDTSVSVSVPAH
jgi:hypothetical protein